MYDSSSTPTATCARFRLHVHISCAHTHSTAHARRVHTSVCVLCIIIQCAAAFECNLNCIFTCELCIYFQLIIAWNGCGIGFMPVRLVWKLHRFLELVLQIGNICFGMANLSCVRFDISASIKLAPFSIGGQVFVYNMTSKLPSIVSR